jgi:quercetin dioxygenase-like cupin family protein
MNRIDEVKTLHHFNSGVYSREVHIKEGWFLESHKHNFDHMSILAQGRVIVEVDNVSVEYKAPCVLNILAEKTHKVIALEDSVWFCIHAIEGTNVTTPEEVEEIIIKKE